MDPTNKVSRMTMSLVHCKWSFLS